jgi:hypothetical protein
VRKRAESEERETARGKNEVRNNREIGKVAKEQTRIV